MKRSIAGIICQIVGIAVMALGVWPLVWVIQKREPDAHLSYNDITYSGYNTVLSIIVLLIAIAIGILLLWLGSRIKRKHDKRV
ncbi:MAG: hypothetical protein ACREC8_08410 [Limisphaerales bacterium]